MKKHSYIFLALAALLCGCASDDYIGDIPLNGGDVITMGMKEKKMTRADKTGADAAADLGNNFVVTGYRNAGTTTDCIFDHYNVNYLKSSAKSTVSNTTGWEYVGQAVNTELSTAQEQTVKYWDTSADNYYFVAFSKGQGVADASGNKTYATFDKVVEGKLGWDNIHDALDASKSAFTITGTVDELNEAYFSDLVSVAKADFKTTTVTPRFRRVGAKLRVALYETIPGYSVKDVKFYTSDDDSAPNDTPKLYASSAIFPTGKGTVYVGYPNKDNSTEDYYLKALTSFKPNGTTPTSSLKFSPLTYGALEKHEKVDDDVYLGRTSATASYSGETAADAYINVTPSGSSILPLTLKCDYTLVPVDGAGETIHVFGATALVPPAYTNWASNYAYTYIFKISDQTDGKAGTPGTDYAGLYPITFDAVEKTDVDDGYEETVSTLGSQAPTITTYQKGAAITENGENIYNAGTIYVTVYDNGVKALTVGKTSDSNISLFEITQEGGKRGDITETVVKSCIEAANDNSKDGYVYSGYNTEQPANQVTLTRVNSKLTAVDKILSVDSPFGTDITVNGARFTAEEGKQYAIQYMNADGKFTYKVLGAGDIKMYYYVNYTAKIGDIYFSEEDDAATYGYARFNDWWGVCDMLESGLLYDQMEWYLDAIPDVLEFIPADAKASFGGTKLRIEESIAKSKEVGDKIEGQLLFNGTVTAMDFSFCDVNDLLSIELPSTLTRIGPYAFEYTGLSEIKIPENVETIGAHAFDMCYNLSSVDLSKCTKLSSIGNSAFNDCEILDEVVLPSSVKTLGKSAFYECDALTNLRLNDGLQTIGDNAFANCDNLTDLVIPSTVTTIASTTPNTYTSIVNGCNNLSTIYLPEYMTGVLHKEAFGNCGSSATSTNVVLYKCAEKTGDLKIGTNCFSSIGPVGNSGMIVLPRNTTELGSNVFDSGIETIVFLSETPPTIVSGTFSNHTKETPNVYVPIGCSSAYSTAWGDNMKDSDGNAFITIVEGTPDGFKIYEADELP